MSGPVGRPFRSLPQARRRNRTVDGRRCFGAAAAPRMAKRSSRLGKEKPGPVGRRSRVT